MMINIRWGATAEYQANINVYPVANLLKNESKKQRTRLLFDWCSAVKLSVVNIFLFQTEPVKLASSGLIDVPSFISLNHPLMQFKGYVVSYKSIFCYSFLPATNIAFYFFFQVVHYESKRINRTEERIWTWMDINIFHFSEQ